MIVDTTHDGRKPLATIPWEITHARGGITDIVRRFTDTQYRIIYACGCVNLATYEQLKELFMPQSCPAHHDRPQVSCEVCYPDSELRTGIERMQSMKVPSAPSSSSPRKKPRRTDDPTNGPAKRKSWKDELFG